MGRMLRFHEAMRSLWRRTSGRARAADWAAVATEIIIVVLGILIAFQVDRWGEARSKAEDERIYLGRIEEESRANVLALQEIIEADNRNSGELIGVVRAMENPALRADLAARQDYGCGILHLPAARTRRFYQDLRAQPVDRAEDRELRDLIGAAVAAQQFTELQHPQFRGVFQRLGETLDRHTLWRFDAADRRGFSCRVDVEALARNPEAMGMLTRAYRNRRVFMSYRREELATQQRLHARARCLIDGSCGS